MAIPNNVPYFPILKTTDAELKAFAALDAATKNGILPIFELTRSRRSKQNIDRCISKRLDSLKEIMGDSPFILDLTVEKQLKNEEIDKILQTHENGFSLWVKLVKDNRDMGLNIIPVIHYDEDNLADVRQEITNLSALSDTLAFRVSPADAVPYLEQLSTMRTSFNNLVLILDAGYKEPTGQADKSGVFANVIDAIVARFPNNLPQYIMCAFSSFPDTVSRYGGDESGSWQRFEKLTYDSLRARYANDQNLHLVHSDYSSVHPLRYDTTGGQWIPRIDFLNDTHMFYYRYRRDDGGYPKAAERVVADGNYAKIQGMNSWGGSEIEIAATGIPNGSAPAHWIAVRINLYITKTLSELTN